MTLNLKGDTDVPEIIQIAEVEQAQTLATLQNGIEPLVSLDTQSNYSAVIDHRWTEIVGSKTLKVVLWYDNEFGYSSRVVDQVKFVADRGFNMRLINCSPSKEDIDRVKDKNFCEFVHGKSLLDFR